MKRLLAASLMTVLLLTSCGGSSSNGGDGETGDAETPRYVAYKTSDFTIDVPDTWDTLHDFTDEYPDNLRIAFKNNVKDASFTANVTVLREENLDELTSADFTQEKMAEHKDRLLNFKSIGEEEIILTVSGAESNTVLNTFSGKNDADSPTLNFMQVIVSKGDRAWIVTASYRPDEDEFTIEKMEHMLNSFAVK